MLIRVLICCLLITFGTQAKAQDANAKYIDSLIAKGTCNCLAAISPVTFESFEPCLIEALSKDSNAFILEVERVMGDVSAESMQKYGYQISKRLLIKMIGECDVFFHLMDTVRKKGLFAMNVDSLGQIVNESKPKVGEKPTGVYYFVLGTYNIRQQKWSEGLAAFEEAIKLEPSNEGYLFFKAFTLENSGRFDESILVYEQLAKDTNKQEYYIFAAIVKRLKAEKLK